MIILSANFPGEDIEKKNDPVSSGEIPPPPGPAQYEDIPMAEEFEKNEELYEIPPPPGEPEPSGIGPFEPAPPPADIGEGKEEIQEPDSPIQMINSSYDIDSKIRIAMGNKDLADELESQLPDRIGLDIDYTTIDGNNTSRRTIVVFDHYLAGTGRIIIVGFCTNVRDWRRFARNGIQRADLVEM